MWAVLIQDASGLGFEPVHFVEAGDVHVLQISAGEGNTGHPLDARRARNDAADSSCRVEVLDTQFGGNLITPVGVRNHAVAFAGRLKVREDIALCWIRFAAHRHVRLFVFESAIRFDSKRPTVFALEIRDDKCPLVG